MADVLRKKKKEEEGDGIRGLGGRKRKEEEISEIFCYYLHFLFIHIKIRYGASTILKTKSTHTKVL